MEGAILNIRPETYRQRFHAAFAPIGWPIIDSPVLVPESMNPALPDAAGYDAIIFTSQVAIDMLGGAGAWRGKTAYAVGSATADAARRAGFTRIVQTGSDASEMTGALAAAAFRQAFYPSAEDVSADISLDDPVRIRRMAIYRMIPCKDLAPELLAAARAGRRIIIPLFSRRSARTAARLMADAGISAQNAHLTAVAMSEDVLAGEPGPWQGQWVADNPTLEAMVAKTRAAAAALTSGAMR